MDSHWPVQHLHFSSVHTILPYSLLHGTLRAVSDGSWKSPLGTPTFILGDLRHTLTVLARGAHQTPSAHPSHALGSSYCSKLSRLLGVVTFIHSLDHQLYYPPQGAIKVQISGKPLQWCAVPSHLQLQEILLAWKQSSELPCHGDPGNEVH